MKHVLVLSPADRVALLLISGLILLGALSYIAGASRAARLFGLGTFISVGVLLILAFYVRT